MTAQAPPSRSPPTVPNDSLGDFMHQQQQQSPANQPQAFSQAPVSPRSVAPSVAAPLPFASGGHQTIQTTSNMAYADPTRQQVNMRHAQWQSEHPRLNNRGGSRLNPAVAEPSARTNLIDAKRAEWSQPEQPQGGTRRVHEKRAQWQASEASEAGGVAASRGRTSLMDAKRAQWQGESYKPTLFC